MVSELVCPDCTQIFRGRKGSALRCVECRKIKRRQEARDRYRRKIYGTADLPDPVCVQCNDTISGAKIDRKYCDDCRPRDCSYLKHIRELLRRSDYRCSYCKTKITRLTPPTVDHKRSLSKGGTNNISNLTIACRSCNARKGTKTVEQFEKEILSW